MKKLSKILLAVFIIISMLAAAFPISTVASAEGEAHSSHPICGLGQCTHSGAASHDFSSSAVCYPFSRVFKNGSLSLNSYCKKIYYLEEDIILV